MNLKQILLSTALTLPLISTNLGARDLYIINGEVHESEKSYTSNEGAEFLIKRVGKPEKIERVVSELLNTCKKPNFVFPSNKTGNRLAYLKEISQFVGALGNQTWYAYVSEKGVFLGMPFEVNGNYKGILLDSQNVSFFSEPGYGDPHDRVVPNRALGEKLDYPTYLGVNAEERGELVAVKIRNPKIRVRGEQVVFAGYPDVIYTKKDLADEYGKQIDAANELLNQGHTFQCI